MLLICNGWLGTVLFLGFFGYLAWRYRRDRTPYGMAGVLVILLSFLYMFAYVAVTAPLEFTMLAVALLWRNDQWRRGLGARSAAAARRLAAYPGAGWAAGRPPAAAAVTRPCGRPAQSLRRRFPRDHPRGGRAAEGGGPGQPAQPGGSRRWPG